MINRKSANLNQRYADTDTDFILTEEIITYDLPAGIGQTAQALSEPIVTQYFISIVVPSEPALERTYVKSQVKARRCRKCSKKIKHADRRLFCKICTPVLSEDSGDAIFF